MRIVTWNIHRCFGADGVYHPDRVLRTLAELRADVIALQEVDTSLRWRDGSDQLTYIARGLGYDFTMGPTLVRDGGAYAGVYGNAVLTRGSIEESRTEDLSFRKFEPRGALCVKLNLAGTDLHVINTHLGLKAWERVYQLDLVLNRLVPERNQGVILLGDFNEWNGYSRSARRLDRLRGPVVPRMATFPSRWPKFALDRVFLLGDAFEGATLSKVSVVDTALARTASDHLPFLVEWRGGPMLRE